jgi:type I restriction enzyme R subunit
MNRSSSVIAESLFESEVVEVLEATEWHKGDSAHFDKLTAIYPDELLKFLRDTQPDKLRGLLDGGLGAAELSEHVRHAVNGKGLIRALLYGVEIVDVSLKLMYTRPAHGLNPETERLYRANRLTVVRQLEYSTRNRNCLDLCLFLNGLPIITAELKSEFNQTVDDAIAQYRTDRNPAGEPLLSAGTGALVHFALDQSHASMTTTLTGRNTKFLPFNRYSEAGELNPLPVGVGDHPTSHVWRRTWRRDNLLHILSRYVTQETRQGDLERPTDTVLFPRFHQWEAAESILSDVRSHGPGRRYLIQHSPGSGKSNTIGWAAHALAELHDAGNNRMFSSVLLLTDRIVLNQQTGETASLLQRFAGTAKHATSTAHLVALLTSNTPVIVSTIQRFFHIFAPDLRSETRSKWEELSRRNFAVLIDEAHSSQQGEYHAAMKRHLEAESADNVSFFAFTATPKEETLALFGTDDGSGFKRPFHVYSMYQALHEGFILNVLQNYYPVRASFCLVVNGEDHLLQASEAKRLQLTSIGQDPTAIEEKSRIIVSHFHEHVASALDGKAKAMVVVSSRLAALRYHRILKATIRRLQLPYECLVAYSDTVYDPETDQSCTENQANGLPTSTEVAVAFRASDQRLLVVADKYQTGFNQPLLNVMYLDKVLSGDIAIVQTLSRLNRTYPGKEAPFILDFVNNEEEVKVAFEKYLGKVELNKYEGMEALEALVEILMSFKVYNAGLIDDIFYELSLKDKGNSARVGQLVGVIESALGALGVELRQQFNLATSKFVSQYGFAWQVDKAPTEQLRKLNAVSRLLKRKQSAQASRGVVQEPLSVLIAELELGGRLPFQAVAPAAPYVSEIDDSLRVLGNHEHQEILLSSFIAEQNFALLHGDTRVLYWFMVECIDALAGDVEVMKRADNAFDLFLKSTALQNAFRKFSGAMLLKGGELAAIALSLAARTDEARELKRRTFETVARCVYNRAAF